MKRKLTILAIVISMLVVGLYVSANTQELITIDTLTVTDITEDSDSFTVNTSFSAPEASEYLTLMLLANDTGSADNASAILHIDQIENNVDSLEFEVTKSRLASALGLDDISSENFSSITLSFKMGGSDIDVPTMKTVTLQSVPVEPQYQKGDINGDTRLNTRDVVALRRAIAGGYEDSNIVIEVLLDVNEDGRKNTRDVVALRSLIAG